jgi:P4 family phage/plasmid primase-like protien
MNAQRKNELCAPPASNSLTTSRLPDIDFAEMIGPVARRLFGDPNAALSTKDQLRFGSRGSLAVEVRGAMRGTWFDHEANVGGGVLDMVRQKKGLTNGEAMEWLRAEARGQVPEMRVAGRPVGVRQRRTVATYSYRAAAGDVVFEVVRYEPKDFRQRRPDGSGGWIWNLNGIAPLPYRLPELLEHRQGPIFVVEGEKDVDALSEIGLTATCNPGGAAKPSENGKDYKSKWPSSFAEFFMGKDVVVMPDNDEAGRAHAKAVAASLMGVAARIRILELPGLAPKGDVSDWIEAGGDRDELLALADRAAEFNKVDAAEGGRDLTVAGRHEDGEPSGLAIGSDAEIARCVIADLERQYGQLVFTEGEFWRYGGLHWETLPVETLWLAISRYDGVQYSVPGGGRSVIKLGRQRIESILACMKPRLTCHDYFAGCAVGINCASGFIQFSEAGVPRRVPHSPDHRFRHVLSAHWPPRETGGEMRPTLLQTLLQGCFKDDEDRDEKINVLGEIAGVAALGAATKLVSPKAIVLLGEQAENGKSEILNALRSLLPAGAVSSIPPTRFGDTTFVCRLAGKLLNATDELPNAGAISSDVFKQVITGEPLTARDVYRSAFDFRPVAQHVYATNSLPEIKGGMDRGVRRRLMVVTFNRVIPRRERVEHIGLRIGREEADLLLDWAVRGAARLMATGRFTEPRSSADKLREWMSASNPVLAWLESGEVRFSEAGAMPEVRTRDAYNWFKRWAVDEGYEERELPKRNGFTQRVTAAGKGVTKRRDSKGPLFVGLGRSGKAAVPRD